MKVCLFACLLIVTGLFSSCKEQEPELVAKVIPETDRFIFDIGDQILYRSNHGSFDTVLVRDVEFYTHSYSEEDFIGRTWNFRVDHGRICLEIADTSWLRILHYACYFPEDCNQCVNMETDSFLEDIPTTHAYFGCEPFGGLVFATGISAMDELTLNNQVFRKVYATNHYHSDTEGFRMYWSLKFGIIRFEGEIGETFYSWDLVVPEK